VDPIRRVGTEHAWRATCLLSALVIVTWLATAEQGKKGSYMTNLVRTGIVFVALALSMGTLLGACVSTFPASVEARNGDGE
jgi:hypothetical protein